MALLNLIIPSCCAFHVETSNHSLQHSYKISMALFLHLSLKKIWWKLVRSFLWSLHTDFQGKWRQAHMGSKIISLVWHLIWIIRSLRLTKSKRPPWEKYIVIWIWILSLHVLSDKQELLSGLWHTYIVVAFKVQLFLFFFLNLASSGGFDLHETQKKTRLPFNCSVIAI